MSEVEKFKTPVSVRAAAVTFFVVSPLIIFCIMSLIDIQIDRYEVTKGVLINNILTIDKKEGINYQNTYVVSMMDERYRVDSVNVSQTDVRLFLDTKNRQIRSYVMAELGISEKTTLVKLLLP